MRLSHKIIYALCMSAALLTIAGTWIHANPPHHPDDYVSVHAAATMMPLMGFAPDSFVNAGDAKALDVLPGVGEVISQRMMETREALGGYRLPEELLLVKGIGEKTLEKILDALDEPLVMLPEISN